MAIRPTYTLICAITPDSAAAQIERSGDRQSVTISASELSDLLLDLSVDGAGNLAKRAHHYAILHQWFEAKSAARKPFLSVVR